jgi:hypothetical protein
MYQPTGFLPNYERLDQDRNNYRQAGPPRRLEVQRNKMEYAKMQLAAYELDRRHDDSKHSQRLAQQYAELELLRGHAVNPLDRIRIRLSNTLIGIANYIRPTGTHHRDIASA